MKKIIEAVLIVAIIAAAAFVGVRAVQNDRAERSADVNVAVEESVSEESENAVETADVEMAEEITPEAE